MAYRFDPGSPHQYKRDQNIMARNKDLPRLLRALAKGDLAKSNKHDLIFNEAANNLDKLDKIEIILSSVAASKEAIQSIIDE